MFLSDFGFGSGTAARASRISAEEMNLKVQQAESLIVYFVSEHNLPFRTDDHFTKLVKACFLTQILLGSFSVPGHKYLS